jgi:putative DNA primase/helicase
MMVSKVITHDDHAVNVHLTYLNPNGTKRVVEGQPTKRVMAGKLPEGSAIRLMPAAEVMGIAEGIETALSASRMFAMPVWSVINGTMLAKWRPPEIAKHIVVFGDHDKNFAGHAKAYAAANRLYIQFGRQVEVRIPDQVGDWNDVWSTDRDH